MPNQRISPYYYVLGLLTPFWLLIGVAVTGALYPGYSHIDQAMSELGALGAPTHEISPLINNYPLGVLFIAFGLAVYATFKQSWPAKASGALITLHGLASFATGYFSCDVACGLENPSTSQSLHNLAGLVMFLSLVLASALWTYLALQLLNRRGFAFFSLACTVAALAVLPLMGAAVESGQGFGLYQRINYGASLLWVAGLAWVLLRRQHR